MLIVDVQVHWSMPQISSTEGEEVKLRAVAIGTYAIPIAIGVTAIGTGVQPGTHKNTDYTYWALI